MTHLHDTNSTHRTLIGVGPGSLSFVSELSKRITGVSGSPLETYTCDRDLVSLYNEAMQNVFLKIFVRLLNLLYISLSFFVINIILTFRIEFELSTFFMLPKGITLAQ